MPPQTERVTLLSLPPEIRNQIYRRVLMYNPQLGLLLRPRIEDAHSATLRSSRSMNAPSILRICRQIYREALPIVYSETTFSFGDPKHNLRWLDQIGPVNVQLLKRLRILVPASWWDAAWDYNQLSWYKLLDRLARKATGLRHLYVYWDFGVQDLGIGKDLRFVRALAKFQGLQSLIISGGYAQQWPIYLTEKTGVWVLEEESPASPDLTRFQLGTETLIP